MYLSKVHLSENFFRNPYEIHRCLWELFPGNDQAARPFLYRLETGSQNGGNILMQSNMRPVEGSEKARLLASRSADYRLEAGHRLRFLLCANPTKRLNVERCRVPFIREDEQKEWLNRKMAPSARLMAPFNVENNRPIYFRRNNQPGKIVTVTYSGILEVQDAAGFMEMVRKGIGPAKAFGCGMLSIARA